MNSKLKAGLITVALAAWCVVVAIGLQFASRYITVTQFSMGLAAIGISVCFYGIYSLVLSKLEFDNTLKRMVDQK